MFKMAKNNQKEEEDDDLGMMVKAFAVENCDEEIDLNVPPTSGNEYLRRVQMEYKNCPAVVVADVDTSVFLSKQTVKMAEFSDILPAPKGCSPSLEWQRQKVAEFSELRYKLSVYCSSLKQSKHIELPNSDNSVKWCRFCLGSDMCSKILHKQKVTDKLFHPCNNQIEGTQPLVSILCLMSQPLTHKVLNYHIKWLEMGGFSHDQGSWLYSLMAHLEKPLTPEVCASLRLLARICAKLRSTIQSADDENLTPLNLIICLVACYFDQKDLMDVREAE